MRVKCARGPKANFAAWHLKYLESKPVKRGKGWLRNIWKGRRRAKYKVSTLYVKF